MTWLQAGIVYAVCWWLTLFMALPVGVTHAPNPAGVDAGAPRKTHLRIKCAVVTILAGFATWGIDLLINSGIVQVR